MRVPIQIPHSSQQTSFIILLPTSPEVELALEAGLGQLRAIILVPFLDPLIILKVGKRDHYCAAPVAELAVAA